MESTILVDLYNAAATQFSSGTLGFLFNHTIKTPLWILGGMGVGSLWAGVAGLRMREQVKKGNFSGTFVIAGHTDYDKTENGVAQTMIADMPVFKIEDIFPFATKEAVKLIKKAGKAVTPEQPSPLQHLDSVAKTDTEKALLADMKKSWKVFWGAKAQDPNFFRQRFETTEVNDVGNGMFFPVLVKEPGAQVQRFRVLLFTKEMLERDQNLLKDNVMIQDGMGHIFNPESNQLLRVDTSVNLANGILGDLETWERNWGVLFDADDSMKAQTVSIPKFLPRHSGDQPQEHIHP